MSAHVYFPAIEKQPGVPATLSRSVLTGLLRNQLHFQGVITTDCMEMNAISEGVGTANGAVKALQAGADMIMISHTYSKQQEALNKVLAGLKNGLIDETQLVQSINRIHVLKQKYLSWEDALKRETVQVKTGTDENKAFADYVYSEGVSIIRNSKKIIPFSADGKTLFIYDTHISYTNVEDKKDHLLFLEGVIRSVAPSADIFDDSDPKLYEVFDEMANGERSYSGIAVLTSSIAGNDQRVEKLMDLEKAGIPMVVIAGKSPYVVRHVPDNIPCICTYELTEPALKKAIKALFGMDVAKGIPPVTL
jgi:beta-N-acetylhexosaminidase